MRGSGRRDRWAIKQTKKQTPKQSMASSATSFMSLLQEEVKCAFCLDQLRAPRTLTCMHGFCEKCLESYEDQNRTPGKIACPVCQEETVLQGSGIAGLRRDFRAIALIERMEREKRNQQLLTTPRPCDICGCICLEGSFSYVSCLECGQIMCKQCGKLHKNMKSSLNHTLTAFSPTPKSVMRNEDLNDADEVGLCEKHNGKRMVLFCSTCLTPVCRDCSRDNHNPQNKHECIPIEQYAPVMREEIMSRLSKVPQLSAEDTEVIALVDDAKEYVKNFGDKIQAAFTRCTDLLRSDLIQKTEKFFHLPMQRVGEVQTKAKGHVEDLKKIQSRAQEALTKGKHQTLAATFKDLRDSLDALLCETPDRSSVEAIIKTMTQLQFHVHDDTSLWSFVFGSREKRNISVNAVGGPYAVAFTKDGRLAVSARFEGPETSKGEQGVWKTCQYNAIKQTNATYRLATEFGMEKRLNDECHGFSSLSDLRFALVSGKVGHNQTIFLLNEKCSCILKTNSPAMPVITVDLEDNIYYSDTNQRKIRTTRPSGTQMDPISIPSPGPSPKHFALCPPSSPDLIMYTHDPSKVSVIDRRSGKLLRTFTRPEWKEVAIGCDNKKILYVLWKNQAGLRTLQRFTTEGHLLDTLFEAEDHSCSKLLLAVSPGGSAAVVTDEGRSGNVTVISTRRRVDLENYNT